MNEKFYYPLMRRLRVTTWTRFFFFILISITLIATCLYVFGLLEEVVMFFVLPFISLLYFSIFSFRGKRFTSAGGDIIFGLLIWIIWIILK